MKKNQIFILLFTVFCVLLATASDKIKYIDTLAQAEDMKVRVMDGVSTDEIVKAKVLFENKNDYFVLLDPSKSFYYINGTKFFSKDREIIIPPSGKRSRVIDAKTLKSQAQALSLVLDGFSRTGNEKEIDFPSLKIKNDTKHIFENVEVMIVDIDYDKANKLQVKIKVKNIGSDILILNSAVIEAQEGGNSLNNIRKRSNKILLRKGKTEVIIVNFQTLGRTSEKLLVWNDAFVTATLLPMSPLEIVLCSSTQALTSYKTLNPSPVVIAQKTEPKAESAVTKTNEKAKPADKKVNPKKKEPIKKVEPIAKVETKKAEESKRSVESQDRELHAAEIDFGNSEGKFYALLIGISDYTDPEIPDLDGLPVKDALTLEKVLLANYTFKPEDVKVLQSPTRREIVIALDHLAKKVTDLDNVLIFYAGHGHYEDDNDIGYWLPKDAEVSNSSNWLYNDQLVASLRKIKSLHTLLISDACFSGSIFKSRSVSFIGATEVIKKKYQLPSRKAMTSGTLKTVPNKSVFIKYLVDRLEKNKEKYYSSSTLYQEIEQPVGNNSNSLPQFGVIQNVGDEGGDFIFIRK